MATEVGIFIKFDESVEYDFYHSMRVPCQGILEHSELERKLILAEHETRLNPRAVPELLCIFAQVKAAGCS